MKGISLFSNVGVGETYLKKCGIDIVIANELIPKRANFYSHLYPDVNMVCGNITDKKTFNYLVEEAIKQNIKFLPGIELNLNKVYLILLLNISF